jgi:hypothetical protein
MTISPEQLRSALSKLNGKRDVRVHLEQGSLCTVAKALLVPAEDDKIIKLTDGTREFLIDAQRVAWVEIG